MDELGLRRAYKKTNKIQVIGNNMYIAGTSSYRDIYDDIVNIPLNRPTRRYRDAMNELRDNPNVDNIIGHSLGGSVALQIQKKNPYFNTTTYGAPVFDFTGRTGNRYRHRNDLISFLDFGAKNSGFSFNPITAHSYTGYELPPKIPGTITS